MDDRYVFDPTSLEKLSQLLQQEVGFWRAKGLFKIAHDQSVQLNVTATESTMLTSDVVKESRFECLFDMSIVVNDLRGIISNHMF